MPDTDPRPVPPLTGVDVDPEAEEDSEDELLDQGLTLVETDADLGQLEEA